MKSTYNRVCLECSAKIVTTDSRKIYCGTACKWKFRNRLRPTTKNRERSCVACGALFVPNQSRGSGRTWCSVLCKDRIRKRERKEYLKSSTWKGIRRAEILRGHGITQDQYDAMLSIQNGVCAICLTKETSRNGFLVVDHCHTKGKVRKLLCVKCNVGLGHFRDDPQLLRKAADYLELH